MSFDILSFFFFFFNLCQLNSARMKNAMTVNEKAISTPIFAPLLRLLGAVTAGLDRGELGGRVAKAVVGGGVLWATDGDDAGVTWMSVQLVEFCTDTSAVGGTLSPHAENPRKSTKESPAKVRKS